MTNKEAIAILTHNWKYRELIDNSYQYEALDLAIKALEDRPTGKWLKIHNPNYSPFDGTCGELSVCPFCGYKTSYKPHKFCPDCGARMEAENE